MFVFPEINEHGNRNSTYFKLFTQRLKKQDEKFNKELLLSLTFW